MPAVAGLKTLDFSTVTPASSNACIHSTFSSAALAPVQTCAKGWAAVGGAVGGASVSVGGWCGPRCGVVGDERLAKMAVSIRLIRSGWYRKTAVRAGG